MGKINGCLKVVFIIFNSLFTCFGIWMMFSLGRATIYGNQDQMGGMNNLNLIGAWIFAICVFGISSFGNHAARTENKCCLSAFAVFMVIGMVLMLIFGVAAIVLKKQYCSEAVEGCEVELLFNIVIGINFGFAFIAMMGLIISTNMISQINRHDRAGVPAIAMSVY